jgi:hypothetical protein
MLIGETRLLNVGGKVTFLVRLGRWICTCLPKRRLSDAMRERIRPLTVGWMACWCDKADGKA